MERFDFYGLGNALVDTEYHIKDSVLSALGLDKGMMTLIDAEQLTAIEATISREGTLVKKASGGSAANSLIATASFGGRVFYSCKVGDDALGDFYYQDLVAAGVATNLDQIREAGTTGRCLVMVTDDAERTMATHLGITGALGAEELDDEALKASGMLYLEGYLASATDAHRAAIRARELAQAQGIPVALTFSDPAMVNYFKPQVAEMLGAGVDLLFCNAEEALAWTGCRHLDDAFRALSDSATRWVCTRGKDGATVFDGSTHIDVAGRVVTPVDTNGAGDMFAGAFLYGQSQGWDAEDCARFGVYCSGHLVTEYGPRLALETHRMLLEEFMATR